MADSEDIADVWRAIDDLRKALVREAEDNTSALVDLNATFERIAEALESIAEGKAK